MSVPATIEHKSRQLMDEERTLLVTAAHTLLAMLVQRHLSKGVQNQSNISLRQYE